MTLYDLTAEYMDIMDSLEASTDEEFSERLEARLEELNGEISDKGEGYAKLIRNIEAEANALKDEIDRLSALKKRREATVERLKSNLLACMEAADADRIETSIGRWTRRQNPPSVEIINENLVPNEYKVPQPPKIDRRAILTAYKTNGEIIDGTKVERKWSVQFR